MKKYIAPVARNINLEMENLVAMSNTDQEGNDLDLSNRRENYSVSDAIWGNSWED